MTAAIFSGGYGAAPL